MSAWGNSTFSGSYRQEDENKSDDIEANSMTSPLLGDPAQIVNRIQKKVEELMVLCSRIDKDAQTIGSNKDRRSTRSSM